jgi:hypothetical protein
MFWLPVKGKRKLPIIGHRISEVELHIPTTNFKLVLNYWGHTVCIRVFEVWFQLHKAQLMEDPQYPLCIKHKDTDLPMNEVLLALQNLPRLEKLVCNKYPLHNNLLILLAGTSTHLVASHTALRSLFCSTPLLTTYTHLNSRSNLSRSSKEDWLSFRSKWELWRCTTMCTNNCNPGWYKHSSFNPSFELFI